MGIKQQPASGGDGSSAAGSGHAFECVVLVTLLLSDATATKLETHGHAQVPHQIRLAAGALVT